MYYHKKDKDFADETLNSYQGWNHQFFMFSLGNCKGKIMSCIISFRKYDRSRLHIWSSTTCRHACPNRIHILERAVRGIGIYMNVDKIEFQCLNNM